MAKNKFQYDPLRYGEPPNAIYESILNPNHHTDKFVLKNMQNGEIHACKFFNWETGFVSASFMAIITLNQYFDLTKIERDSNGETYEDYLGI